MKTIPITINMPADLHQKLCTLAAIINQEPEQLALWSMDSDIEQMHNGDTDLLIHGTSYASREEAETVIKKADALAGGKPGGYFVVYDENDSSFSIERSEPWRKLTNVEAAGQQADELMPVN